MNRISQPIDALKNQPRSRLLAAAERAVLAWEYSWTRQSNSNLDASMRDLVAAIKYERGRLGLDNEGSTVVERKG